MELNLVSSTTKLSLNYDLLANLSLLGEWGNSQTPKHPRHLSFPLSLLPPDQSRRAGLNPLCVSGLQCPLPLKQQGSGAFVS